MGHLGHRRSPGFQCPSVHLIGILDIQAEETRRIRPFLRRVERHHHRVADPELGVPYGAILIMDPRELLRPKRAPDKLDEPGGVPRNDPRRDRVIALRNSPDLGARVTRLRHNQLLPSEQTVPLHYT